MNKASITFMYKFLCMFPFPLATHPRVEMLDCEVTMFHIFKNYQTVISYN